MTIAFTALEMKNNWCGRKKKEKKNRIARFLPFFPTAPAWSQATSARNHTRFQTKLSKVYARFLIKTAQKPHPLEERMG